MALPRDAFESRRSSSPHAAAAPFSCAACGHFVSSEAPGTRQRNHCPHCLCSLHVDLTIGDRRNLCRGVMDPISLWIRPGGELALLHRCRRCGTIRSNRLAGDDNADRIQALVQPLEEAARSG